MAHKREVLPPLPSKTQKYHKKLVSVFWTTLHVVYGERKATSTKKAKK